VLAVIVLNQSELEEWEQRADNYRKNSIKYVKKWLEDYEAGIVDT
jgi:hypothetical protein